MSENPPGTAMKRTGRAFIMTVLCLSGLLAGTVAWPQNAHANHRLESGFPGRTFDGVKTEGPGAEPWGLEGLKLHNRFYAFYARVRKLAKRAGRDADAKETRDAEKALEKRTGLDLESWLNAGTERLKRLFTEVLPVPGALERPAFLPLTSEGPKKRELGTELDMVEIKEAPTNILLAFGMNKDFNTETDEVRVTMRFRLPF